jgi:hypothetical protein
MIRITADFNMAEVEAFINGEVDAWFDELVQDCRQAAKQFVDRIRAGSTTEGLWKNRTWNLRSSIGYLLVYNGDIVEEYFPEVGGGTEGTVEGKAYAEEIALLVNDREGIHIVIVAGMEYAIFVEGHNIDVLTHASKRFPKELLKEFNK